MTTTLAITGKSGSGKTTLVKGFLRVFQEYFPDKTILLVDNDLSGELGHSFGYDIRNTIYGIRNGKHEYKTGIPEDMTKQEYVEWAMEDIVFQLEENVDIVVTWLVASKDCRCPITDLINNAVAKLMSRYDFVIFDCEFDLKYLSQLVDLNIDTTIIVSRPYEESIVLAKRICDYSEKYSGAGQMGVVLNTVKSNDMNNIYNLLDKYNLKTLGSIPFDDNLVQNPLYRESKTVIEAIKEFYFRLNLPQKQE